MRKRPTLIGVACACLLAASALSAAPYHSPEG
jgi:hypothetical protein